MPKSRNLRLNWNLPIAYASGESNYTTLHYPDGRRVIMSYTLSKVATRLNLLRIHKQIAVNPAYVTSVKYPGIKPGVVFIGKAGLIVAKRRVKDVFEKLNTNHS